MLSISVVYKKSVYITEVFLAPCHLEGLEDGLGLGVYMLIYVSSMYVVSTCLQLAYVVSENKFLNNKKNPEITFSFQNTCNVNINLWDD